MLIAVWIRHTPYWMWVWPETMLMLIDSMII